MNVTTWKSIDVEVSVDVTLDDCINEMLSRVEALSEDAQTRRREWLPIVDWATRILEKIPADVFSHLTCEQWDILRPRLAHVLPDLVAAPTTEEDQPS